VDQDEFDASTEASPPVPVARLAQRGTKTKPKPLYDVQGIDPEDGVRVRVVHRYRVMAAVAGQHGEGLLTANLMDSGERDGRSTACRVGRHAQQVGVRERGASGSWPALENAPASLVMPAVETALAHRERR
jgi:hypothetical protein